jgi:cation transport ATPase
VLVDVRGCARHRSRRLLAWAASAEQYSAHVLADGIRRAARDRGIAVEAATMHTRRRPTVSPP